MPRETNQRAWTGQLDITVFHNGRRSVARDIFFEKALKVMRPIYLNGSAIPTFYIVNVGGGYLDGDRYKMNFNVEDDAHVTLTSQGATKIYKTLEDHVEQYQTFNLEHHSYLEYVGDPIIAYANANFFQFNRFNLRSTSSLFYTDIVTPGYDRNDANFSYQQIHLLNEIYIDDQLVVFDNLRLNPDKECVSGIGYMEGYTHLGSCYFIHPKVSQKLIDRVYEVMKSSAQHDDCRLAISQLPTHGFNIRILAFKTQVIEQVLNAVQSHVVQTLYNRSVNFLRKY
ncbi:urease accessory protein UreD [Staphylococcus sp. SQ8-PEA]|uniref:Urease accessory protein UreD n=1 Tax=Staphylococcus marylandisciuri TaxID=2981529 RepID=A0ABT2QN53_9STAP|nr:urease accessory protein UreD [Staphylococcus marylandisciuri]MCU5745409.1 urease accessory protein UreD [Staphylococcus marylandisciuri]